MAQLDNILRSIKSLERQVRILSAVKQPLGGDLIQIGSGNLGATGAMVIAAGAEVTLTVAVTPTDPKLTLYNLYETIHIDTDTAAFRYHDGASLTSGQKKLKWHTHPDWEASNDTTGLRKYFVTIKNEDSVSHTYYYYVKLYSLEIPFA